MTSPRTSIWCVESGQCEEGSAALLTFSSQYDTSAPTTSRDFVFKAINDLVASQFKQKQGLIGLAPWSYGGTHRSKTQAYNNQGILIAGDPPQERE